MSSDYKYNDDQKKEEKKLDHQKYDVWDLLTDTKFYAALIVVIIIILQWSGLIFNH